jgi:hypothetical protein
MSVRAKFKVASITKDENGASIILRPVVSGSKENEQFFRWTPSGEIKIGTINAAAAEQFEPGVEFYVDFTPANQATA